MSKSELLSKTRDELLAIAQRLGLRGISTLRKNELAERVHEEQTKKKSSAAAKQPMGVSAVARKVAAAVKRRAVRKRVNAVPPARKTTTSARKTPSKAEGEPVISTKEAKPTNGSGEIAAHKFDVAPAEPPKQRFVEEHLGELPDAYGTGRVFLTARDPHWLYAYWDLNWQQIADYRGQSSDGRVLLRLFEKNHTAPAQELSLQNDSRNWYIPVNKAATTYTAELGFWRHDGQFHVINRSREATTPPDVLSPDTTARFVTIPIDITFRDLLNIIRAHMKDGEHLADALHRLQAAGFRFPFQVGLKLGPWSEEQERALEHILGGDLLRRIQVGSFEISEWLRRRLQEQLGSAVFSAFSPGGASWSAAPQKGFWFAVNAELIIYGATEPDAKVTVDGKPIKLRSDGTFSFHYAFPDGEYRMPIVAVSRAGDDQRGVELAFKRSTATNGEVGKVKQPGHLKSPAAA
jgi:hypothetical protein